MWLPRLSIAWFFASTVFSSSLLGQESFDLSYPYAPDKPIAGTLDIVGSTLMQQLASLWLSEFKELHPELVGSIDCRGSESALPQLAQERPTIAMLSRSITTDELAKINSDPKHPIRAITVGRDVLAMIVHPENPIDAVRWFPDRSSMWAQGTAASTIPWSILGAPTPLGEEPIKFHLPSKEHGLRSLADRFLVSDLTIGSDSIVEVSNPYEITDSVHRDRTSIAMVSATRALDKKVKALPIVIDRRAAISPFDSDALENGYPWVRDLSLMFSVDSEGNRHPVIEEFLAFVLSRNGQDILNQDGFVPLEPLALDHQRDILGWEVIK
jgi:phosphate transport system substrate-binding protein